MEDVEFGPDSRSMYCVSVASGGVYGSMTTKPHPRLLRTETGVEVTYFQVGDTLFLPTAGAYITRVPQQLMIFFCDTFLYLVLAPQLGSAQSGEPFRKDSRSCRKKVVLNQYDQRIVQINVQEGNNGSLQLPLGALLCTYKTHV